MNQTDVESSITTQYISETKSTTVKIRLNSGSVYRGQFIKNNQKEFNKQRNKWIITIDFVELMLNGVDINSFFPFKHKYKKLDNFNQ